MSRESSKLKSAGIVEIVLTMYSLGCWSYIFIGLIVRKSLDSPTVFMFIGVLGCLILKLAMAIFAVRKTNNVKNPHIIVCGLMVMLVLSVLWLAAVFFIALNSKTDIAILHLICAVTDVVVLGKLISGYSHIPLNDPDVSALSTAPYGDEAIAQQGDNSTE